MVESDEQPLIIITDELKQCYFRNVLRQIEGIDKKHLQQLQHVKDCHEIKYHCPICNTDIVTMVANNSNEFLCSKCGKFVVKTKGKKR